VSCAFFRAPLSQGYPKIKGRSITNGYLYIIGTLLAVSGLFFSYKIAAVPLTTSIFIEIIIIQTTLNKQNSKLVDKEHL
jgi:hypothetical protein